MPSVACEGSVNMLASTCSIVYLYRRRRGERSALGPPARREWRWYVHQPLPVMKCFTVEEQRARCQSTFWLNRHLCFASLGALHPLNAVMRPRALADAKGRCPGEAGYTPIFRDVPADFADFKRQAAEKKAKQEAEKNK